ncbi:MAG: POTRA domain-containing protein, partial [Chitinophagales bacterium]
MLLNTDNQTTLVPAHAAQSSVNKTSNSPAQIDTNKQVVHLTDLEFALAGYDKKHLVVDEIILKGNKRTKPFIILRELDFGVGDTLPTLNLPQVIKENQDQINNTRLFNEVVISIDQWMQDRIRLVVEVEERWYIFPAPIFELVDRNFNVWWTEQNRDLSRTKYGFDFSHGNFRGRRETLRAVVRFGYTRQFEFAYQIPFLDKQQKTGIKPRISYITHREIPYTHSDNRNVFYQHDETVRTRFRTGLSFYRRPNIHNDHQLHVYYNSNTIADTIAQLNPNYFLNGQTEQRYFDLAYTFTSDHRDRRAYPLEGKYLRVKLNKQGTG